MSEKLQQHSQEQHRPSHEAAEISRKNIERIKAMAEQEKQPGEAVEALQATAAQEALSGKELEHSEPEPQARPHYQQKELKDQAFDKTMDRVRSQLSPAERQFSKLMHQKTVDKLSGVGAKTIARPSGVLGGGIAACLGSSFILYYARHLGFTYNYSTFIVLFVGGFGVGIIAEMLLSRLKRLNK